MFLEFVAAQLTPRTPPDDPLGGVLGAGTMGRNRAHLAIAVSRRCSSTCRRRSAPRACRARSLARILFTPYKITSIATAVLTILRQSPCDWIIEAVGEDLAVKRAGSRASRRFAGRRDCLFEYFMHSDLALPRAWRTIFLRPLTGSARTSSTRPHLHLLESFRRRTIRVVTRLPVCRPRLGKGG